MEYWPSKTGSSVNISILSGKFSDALIKSSFLKWRLGLKKSNTLSVATPHSFSISRRLGFEEINKERNVVYQERSELLEKFDNKILTFYEKIKRWAKDSAVVPVKKQACYGCFMKINDKTYAEVIKAEEIINCPHCGRILYKEDEAQEA